MTRADDEVTLHILDLRARGQSLAAISRAVNMTREAVRSRIRKVIKEDCRADPDACHYWRPTHKET